MWLFSKKIKLKIKFVSFSQKTYKIQNGGQIKMAKFFNRFFEMLQISHFIFMFNFFFK
jgi:hypothetical protein